MTRELTDWERKQVREYPGLLDWVGFGTVKVVVASAQDNQVYVQLSRDGRFFTLSMNRADVEWLSAALAEAVK